MKGNFDLMEVPFILILHEKQETHVSTSQLDFDHLDTHLVLLQYGEKQWHLLVPLDTCPMHGSVGEFHFSTLSGTSDSGVNHGIGVFLVHVVFHILLERLTELMICIESDKPPIFGWVLAYHRVKDCQKKQR